AGEDLLARRRERLRPGRAGCVRCVDFGALPAERLRERRARDVARIAAAHRRRARDELDVAPPDTGVGEAGPRRVPAVLDEVAARLAPRVHADTKDRDIAAHCGAPAGFHFQISLSVSPSRYSVSSTSSIDIPISSASTPTPRTTWPSTIIRSRS